MFLQLSYFAVDYMSMSALAHDSSEISSQTRTPVSSPAFAMASSLADEAGYRTCLEQIQGAAPTEFCLTAITRWRSEKLAQSLRLEESLKEFNIETIYQPNGGEADRPQLEVRISGTPNRFPGSALSWNLSAEAVGALRD